MDVHTIFWIHGAIYILLLLLLLLRPGSTQQLYVTIPCQLAALHGAARSLVLILGDVHNDMNTWRTMHYTLWLTWESLIIPSLVFAAASMVVTMTSSVDPLRRGPLKRMRIAVGAITVSEWE
jgi:hypothetical protein